MGLLEREIGRRKLIIEAGKKVPLIVVGAGASFELACSLLGKSDSATDPNLITYDNYAQKIPEALGESFQYPTQQIFPLPEITEEAELDSLPRSEVKELAKYGIESFFFAQNIKTDELVMVLNFAKNVRLGKSYTNKKGQPAPSAFVIYGNGQLYKAEGATDFGYKFEEETYKTQGLNALLQWATLNFPISKNQITGKEFVVILNYHFLNVAGLEQPSFLLPFRFQVGRVEPFARNTLSSLTFDNSGI
ncbi:MAG: hypothetical protein A2868_02020 [Candidatus Levybacteria bacterium RIFCSPHIGHO2_01_FULL_40_15b]|nr:MAG: hypothetical protein A2868_02020 [Candidatus Levybacteria bacterium RIFCSPHIGHO2_01_FULL_40_15b]